MGIWHRRSLFLLCTAWIAAPALVYVLYGPDGEMMRFLSLLCLGMALICLGVALLLPSRSSPRPPRPWRLICLRLMWVLLSATLALHVSGVYFSHQVHPDDFASCAEASAEAEHATPMWSVTATVTERLSAGGQICTYGLALQDINGQDVGSALHPAQAYLLCRYVSDLQPGYTFTMTATPAPLEEVALEASSLRGDGYSVALISESETQVHILSDRPDTLIGRLHDARRLWAASLNRLVGHAGGGLPAALLLGERSALAKEVRRDFTRAGAAHMLAISGLHMTLLFGVLEGLLRLLRCPRKLRALCMTLAMVAYLLLLGFPPSATRAAIMLGMVYLSWLFASRSDPLTSLGLAGALILGFSPCALADTGFWMSFSATWGLVTVMPVLTRLLRRPSGARTRTQRLARGGLGLLTLQCTGIVAMSFSLWITAPKIGTLSLLSPFSTFLLTPLCALALLLSLLALPLRTLWVGKAVIMPLLRWVLRGMIALTHALGQPRWALLSLTDPHTGPILGGIIAFMTASLLLLLGIRLRHSCRWLVLLPMLCGWIAIGATVGISTQRQLDTVTLAYLRPSAASEALVLTRGRASVLCDLSDGSHTALQGMMEYIRQNGSTEIETLLLTHYHSRMIGTLWQLLSSETVRALYLPLPTTQNDYYLMQAYLEKAAWCGVPAYLYTQGKALQVFDHVSLCLQTSSLPRSAQPILMITIQTPDQQVLYCGGALMESDIADLVYEAMAQSGIVIFGDHGPKCKQAYTCADSDKLEMICFGDQEVAAYFDARSLPKDLPVLLLGQMRTEMDIMSEKG